MRLWITTEDGVSEPVWSCSPVLPSSLVDLLATGDCEEGEEEEEENKDELTLISLVKAVLNDDLTITS